MEIEQRHLDARHKILDEVMEACNTYFAPNQARFINDAMEMYAMYRTAELSKENAELKYKLGAGKKDINASEPHFPLGGVSGALPDVDYWKQRCLLSEKCLIESPCDQDITSEQIKAHSDYGKFLMLYGNDR